MNSQQYGMILDHNDSGATVPTVVANPINVHFSIIAENLTEQIQQLDM